MVLSNRCETGFAGGQGESVGGVLGHISICSCSLALCHARIFSFYEPVSNKVRRRKDVMQCLEATLGKKTLKSMEFVGNVLMT